MRINIKSIINFIKQHSKLTAGVGAGLLIGSAGSIALAAIPDTNRTIHACYSSGTLGTGLVRIIDSPTQSCLVTETAVSWGSASPGNFVTNMVGADLTAADLRYRNFAGADIHNATFAQANLTDTDLHGANISGSTMNENTIIDADFTGANLSNTHFDGAGIVQTSNFTGANFTNAYLYGLNMSNSTFTGATWSNTTCPDLNNSDYVGNTCAGHLAN
jgi:hypothetical protein